MQDIIKCTKLSKYYIDANGEKVFIFNNLNFTVKEKDNFGIFGPSGCGKTSLLQIIGLLDNQYQGEIEICGVDPKMLNSKEKNDFLKTKISFIHQFFHLFPEFTALENVMLTQLNTGINQKTAMQNAKAIFAELGIESKMHANPWELSGGERQRVAIARAICHKPKIILADEPTGSLDKANGQIVIELLKNACQNYGVTLVVVTHDLNITMNNKIQL